MKTKTAVRAKAVILRRLDSCRNAYLFDLLRELPHVYYRYRT
jgi:hypothetical protein